MPSDAKSRLLAKGRSIQRDIERYQAFGYVTDVDHYEDDDRKLTRGIDSLYDLARKHGLHEDVELQQVRMQLRDAKKEARERAFESRRQLRQGQSDALAARSKAKVPSGMQGYLDEIALGESKRRSRRGG